MTHPMLDAKGWAESWDRSVFLVGELYKTLSGEGGVGSSVPEKSWGDLRIFTIYAVILFTINWGVRLMIVDPLGRFLLARGTRPAKSSHVQKFSQAAMEVLFYGSFFIMGAILVPSQKFFWPSIQWWDFDRRRAPLTNDITCFYIMYCSRYVQGGISVLMEHKRKDFWEMQIHHVVTAVLVALSYMEGWVRVGVVIMLLLDPADVPLHTAKMFKYVSESGAANSRKKVWNQFFADRWFEVFAVVFFVTRIGMYPYTVWSAFYEASIYEPVDLSYKICTCLLLILLFLQCYWMFLIVKAVVNMILKGGIEDIRSDSEDEEEEKPKKA
eukprot:TRINITY_DN6805_c0_g1_i1.p1 TRINITY_DN6805_c0_g1~~TRINITY_DN6805_c0_g1_i1.p1  ORF type:complete len:326 (+),score=56.57 TRINITY_DN6805_c0_g1_i1:51-1028(+)